MLVIQNTSGKRFVSNTSVRFYYNLEISRNKIYVSQNLAVKLRAVQVKIKISRNIVNKSKLVGYV